MTDLTIYGFAYAGFVSLSLAMERHHRAVWGTSIASGPRTTLRLVGYSCLGVSAAVAVHDRGAGIGITTWIAAMSLVAVMHALTLPYWPRVGAAGASRR